LNSLDRWRLAQAHERQYWEQEAIGIADGEIEDPTWYKDRARNFLQILETVAGGEPTATLGQRVVEVGSGPVGIVAFIPAPDRHAIDPLNDYYKTKPQFSAFRDRGVTYTTARGEDLPFKDGSVDTLISENALDHVELPLRVVAEFVRVLRTGGRLFLRVEVYRPVGAAIHWTLAHTRLDPLHPHTFTPAGVVTMLERAGLAPLHQEVSDYAVARQKGLASPSRRGRLLALIGMNAIIQTLLLQKR
jgi:SAM-dependent methyltransferase